MATIHTSDIRTTLVARYPGRCALTGQRIRHGDRIHFLGSRGSALASAVTVEEDGNEGCAYCGEPDPEFIRRGKPVCSECC